MSYAFFSLTDAMRRGSNIYHNKSGKRIQVTFISDHQDGRDYEMSDKKIVGNTRNLTLVQRNRPDRSPQTQRVTVMD